MQFWRLRCLWERNLSLCLHFLTLWSLDMYQWRKTTKNIHFCFMKSRENINWYLKTFFAFLCMGIGIGLMRNACCTRMRTWVQVCTPVKTVCGVCIFRPSVWGRAEKGRFPIVHWLASITKMATFSFSERPCIKEQAVRRDGRRHLNPLSVLHWSIREEERHLHTRGHICMCCSYQGTT